MAASDQPKKAIPNDFFDPSSFSTLSGSVVLTWVATNALVKVIGGVDPKLIGFIIALVVAGIGYAISEKRSLKKLAVVPFNGLLIYLTIVGGTSFLPPPQASVADQQPGTETPADTTQVIEKAPSIFFSQWNPDRQLIEKTADLNQQKQKLEVRVNDLQQTNQLYKVKLDSTRQVLQQVQLPTDVQNRLMNTLRINPSLNNVPINGLNN
ncbi:MAG: hypothetical protein R3211_00860 [Balneolaceae bacterium]|nr:hypothetical protein [Balneolaceae bacterium]